MPTDIDLSDPSTRSISNDCTYTAESLATFLHRKPDWVIDNVLGQGCAFRRVGRMYLISGRAFQLWVERGSDSNGLVA